jgi:hypothetical protein
MKLLPEQVEIDTLPALEAITFSYRFLVRSYTGPNRGGILVLGLTSTHKS